MAVRKFGRKFVYSFCSEERIKKIENSKLFKNPKKIEWIMLILFLIPGTPKDLLVYILSLIHISQVGNYADVDGNGTVDGVIYADLAIGGSGQWTDSDGTYTIPKGSNFREYTESGSYTANGFGTKGVIKATSTSGNERFYVMALSDVDSSTHCWYNRAYGNMSDYASTTSGDFGTGEKNTQTMISKWNSSAYGAQTTTGSFPDMWGLSTVQSGTWNGSTGWYVPSRGEWTAFASQLGITKSNYTSFGLSLSYWSSSQSTTRGAWLAYFSIGYMNNGNVNTTYYVRLGTTY